MGQCCRKLSWCPKSQAGKGWHYPRRAKGEQWQVVEITLISAMEAGHQDTARDAGGSHKSDVETLTVRDLQS